MSDSRSKLPFVILSGCFVLSGIVAVVLALRQGKQEPAAPGPVASNPSAVTPGSVAPPSAPGSTPEMTAPVKKKGVPPIAPVAAADPARVVGGIGKALETGDMEAFNRLLGKEALDPAVAERLKVLAGAGSLKLREVGELEQNELVRWAVELPNGQPLLFLDLRRKDGKWVVDKVTLPSLTAEAVPKGLPVDSLGIADAFLQAALHQNFEQAKRFADPSTVSDAKIAGLCILFEEGNYRLRTQKPLRVLLSRPEVANYLANVETTDASQTAQFSLMLQLPPGGGNWRVSEVNLDQLLADYAKRFAGGDVYYTPLLKNPKGGDTLVLYFDFDQDKLNERTRRQLEIVAQILKLDAGKKLTLSGHTDALGGKDYNATLSERRADVVRDYLVAAGVAKAQIVTVAKGMTQPRRPNFTESGADDPEGRRANRRTEIYLDF